MRIMQINAIALIGSLVLSGCSFFDFFGYEDNAPLHVVSRPEGYPSVMFGAELAPTTFTQGEQQMDLVGVSGGTKTPTLIYRLSKNGALEDVEDPYDEYLSDKEAEADAASSGSSLVGLPTWKDETMFSGCIAVGEPAINEVTIICEQDKEIFHLGANSSGENGPEDFGLHMAGVRPYQGDNWLLAVASQRTVTVFSASHQAASNRTEPAAPTYQDQPVTAVINDVAAGRLSDGRIFVAVSTGDVVANVPARVHLFLQTAPNSVHLTQAACMNMSQEPAFGGVLASGDLDADGEDELITAFSSGDSRHNEVLVWRIADVLADPPQCNSEPLTPAATVTPGDGELDVKCEDTACNFGVTVEVGDISTDDSTPELIVGAPGAKVDGTSAAGAVYIYRGEEVMTQGEPLVAGRVADSTAHGGHHFGGGLAVAPMAGRNELLVGAPGKGKFFIAFCTGVGEDIENGADTTTSAGGSVVSTRCRAD